MADKIIGPVFLRCSRTMENSFSSTDTSRQFDADTQTKMIAAAVKYRQAEKNTPPDFTTNPPRLRNSVFCQKAPANSELDGLVQAQDPANDPNLFFDPAKSATIMLGSQPNTSPFGTNGGGGVNPPANNTNGGDGVVSPGNNTDVDHGGDDVNDGTGNNNGTDTGNIGNFGSCSVPQIEFGQGFDGRKETSFQPVDQSESIRVVFSLTVANFVDARILHPRFGSKYRRYHPGHVRPAREHLQGRRYRSQHLR